MGVITEQYGFRTSVTKAERDLSKGALDLANLEQYVKLKSGAEIEASDAHIVNAVDFLLQHAYDSRASDIHIEPKREYALIRFRIDGVLHEIQRVPKLVNLAITSRLKTMCRMDIAEKRRPQDGRIKTEHEGKEIELRVSTLPTAFGEKMVMRIFDPDVMLRDLSGLGFYEDELKTFADWIQRPHGIILVTGPTGSGKTVTLYSALKTLASPEINITTIEDPIEMVYDDFNQTSGAHQDRDHVRVGAAHDPAPGSRHHHGRRDPRSGDRAERRAGGAHRSPGLLDAAHERRVDVDHAADRSRDPAVPDLVDADRHDGAAADAEDLRGLQTQPPADARRVRRCSTCRPRPASASS